MPINAESSRSDDGVVGPSAVAASLCFIQRGGEVERDPIVEPGSETRETRIRDQARNELAFLNFSSSAHVSFIIFLLHRSIVESFSKYFTVNDGHRSLNKPLI